MRELQSTRIRLATLLRANLPRLGRVVVLAVPLGILAFLWVVWIVQAWGPGDALVYLAAGERLNAGHQLYALSPGDRPVWLYPPYWTVPLLSPPFIAVLWRPLALLPEQVSISLWCAAATSVALASLVQLYRRATLPTAIAMCLLCVPFAVLVGSGNVDGLRLGATLAIWLFATRGRSGWAGFLVGLSAAIKVTPVLLFVWLLLRRDRPGLVAAAATLGAAAVLSIAGAGLASHFEFLSVAGQSAAHPTPLSLSGLLELAGTPGWATTPISLALALLFMLGAVRFRGDGRSFACVVLAMVAIAPAGGMHSWAAALAALAPLAWPERGLRRSDPSVVPDPAASRTLTPLDCCNCSGRADAPIE